MEGLNLRRRPPIIIPLTSSSFKVQTSVAQFFKHFRIKELAVPVLWKKKIQNPRVIGSGCLRNRRKVFMKELVVVLSLTAT
jgi:hypothetical protein